MSALSKIPSEAAQACVALAYCTIWPAEEWAIATQTLITGELPMDQLGMTRLIELSLATKAAPSELAVKMVAEYRKAAVQGLQSV